MLNIIRQNLQQKSDFRLTQRLHHVLEIRREVEETLRFTFGELLLHELLSRRVGARSRKRRAFNGSKGPVKRALGHAEYLANVSEYLRKKDVRVENLK